MAWLFLVVQVSHLALKKTNARAMQEAIWPWSELEQRNITNEVLVSISRIGAMTDNILVMRILQLYKAS